MKYLLDTNICIYIIRRKPLSVIEHFKTLPIGSIGISTITLSELQYGVAKSSFPDKNQQALDNFLTPLEIVDFDFNAAIHYGNIRAELELAGTPIGALDTLIAAHARSLNVTLVSNNLKEFERVKDLKLENWVEVY